MIWTLALVLLVLMIVAPRGKRKLRGKRRRYYHYSNRKQQ